MTSIAHVNKAMIETQTLWRHKDSPRSQRRRRNLADVIDTLNAILAKRCESLVQWIRTTSSYMSIIDASLHEVTSMVKGAKKQLYVNHHMVLARDRIHTMRFELTTE